MRKLMQALATMAIAFMCSMGEAGAQTCLPAVLALSAAPYGSMHPAKNPTRPAIVDTPLERGIGAVWWCADGSVWEYHVTAKALASMWGTPRKLQAAYVANPAAMRAMPMQSCIGTTSKTTQCYAIPGNRQICGNPAITDQDEKLLCTALLRQAAAEWPK